MARMLDDRRQRSERARSWWWAGALALALASSCAMPRTVADDAGVLPRWRELLQQDATVVGQRLSAELRLPELDPATALVVVDRNWRVPGEGTGAEQRAALRAFVERGGRLVLFGHAARLVSELGIEAEHPENTVYRWGFDRRAVRGDAQLTLHFVSGRVPELYEGLAGSVSEYSIPVTGGAPCNEPLCAWQQGAARDGEVLARLGEVLDGEPAPLGPPVLLRWRCGRGEVLACGLLPDVDHDDDAVRANARGVVRRCADWAAAGAAAGARPLVLLDVPERTPERLALDRDGPPIVPLLAHWGWQASLYDGDAPDAVRPLDELVREALVPSFGHGADVLELTLTDAQHGAPLGWSAKDQIEVPVSWRGQ
ncbi:MAG: hypothetical protein KAI24_03730, partial [Planctomycetes bacterium]|nr:hypothetical protein [Planctomycetota bacterium]